MASSVTGSAQTIREIELTVPEYLLPEEERTIIKVMFVVSLVLSLLGIGLSLASIGLCNAKSNNLRDVFIDSFRFPCLVFGLSFLCHTLFIKRYFRGSNALER